MGCLTFPLNQATETSVPITEQPTVYSGAEKSLARPGKKQATATEDLMFIYPIYYHNWRNISTLYIYIYIYVYKTRLASKEVF